jgi:hypothetical protein
MKNILSILLLFLFGLGSGQDAPVAPLANSLDGTYRLVRLRDAAGTILPIPATTTMVLKTTGAAGSGVYKLDISIVKGTQTGNKLFAAQVTINGTDGSTSIPRVLSTRRFTPFLDFERLLVAMLQATDDTSVNRRVLKLTGSQGLMRFNRLSRK